MEHVSGKNELASMRVHMRYILMKRLLGARLHPQLILANDAVVTTFRSVTALYSSTIDPGVFQNDIKIAIYL